jgi:small subunit ribosomal protein S2
MIDFRELVKAGVHFGHKTTKWCPKMAPYIWGHRGGIHLIDVSKTAYALEKAGKFLEEIASQKKPILWIGSKAAAKDIVFEAAKRVDMPFINHRWVGGLITNYSQVKKTITKLLHYEDVLAKSSDFNYTKKELNLLQKNLDKLNRSVGGIRRLAWPIGALVVIDVNKEETAIREATQLGIPVVAIVDTNSDPSFVDYVIPGNDDSPKSIKILVDYLADAIQRGKDKVGAVKEKEQAAPVEVATLAVAELEIPEIILEEDEEEAGVTQEVNKKPKRAPVKKQ